MEYELALMSFALAGGFWGWFYLRRRPNGTPWFGVALFGVTLLCVLGLVGRGSDSDILGALGAVGVGGGTCMILIGPGLRYVARRLSTSERYGIASRLLDVADLLTPGSGVGEDKALLGAMREIREGRIEQTVDALTAAKHNAPPEARVAIDERIAMLYLAAYRWHEGIKHAEATLAVPPRDASFAPVPEGLATPVALRRALGMAPPVWVELLGAYGRTGQLNRAAGMLARLEDACAGRDDATSAMWVHRARMIFLALAGRVPAVEALTTARVAHHLSASARTYWRAVAHERHGDAPAATEAYARARRGSRGMPRELIDKALANLAAERGESLRPVELGDQATEVVARIEAAPIPSVSKIPREARHPAAWLLTGLVLATAVAVDLAFGTTTDYGVMLRAGAMIHSPIEGGEWWRLVSCVMIHVGIAHLALNAASLFVLARSAEGIFGTSRTIAIFVVAGLGGALASFALGPGPSAGASGAVLGLLAAEFVELTLYRERYAHLRPVWAMLGLCAITTLAGGFYYAEIDQWAHGGGLATGALLGGLLSPSVPWRRVGLWLARGLAVAGGVVAVIAIVMIARTSAGDSLNAGGTRAWYVDGVTVDAPATWTVGNGGELYDSGLFIVMAVARHPASDGLVPSLAAYTKGEPDRIRSRHLDEIDRVSEPLVPLPDSWVGSELEASAPSDLGDRARFHVVVAGKQYGDTLVLVSLYMPESLAISTPEFFTAMLASVRDVEPPAAKSQ